MRPNQFRKDLLTAGIGDGNHAFRQIIPINWFDGDIHEISLSSGGHKFISKKYFFPFIGFTYKFCVATVIRDEGRYLEEWLEYHLAVGVQHFIIYNHMSTDNTSEILQRYESLGLVTQIPWTDIDYKNLVKSQSRMEQIQAFNHALLFMKDKTQWLSFLDADEFIVPANNESIVNILNELDTLPVLNIYWRCFGSSGYTEKTSDLVIKRFTMRAPDGVGVNQLNKCIVQPSFCRKLLDPHTVETLFGDFGVNIRKEIIQNIPEKREKACYERITVHHYHTKSWGDYLEKVSRGWLAQEKEKKHEGWKTVFSLHDRNDEEDTSLVFFANKIKDRILLRRSHKFTSHSFGKQGIMYNWSWFSYHIYGIKDGFLSGWIWDVSDPNKTVTISVFIDDDFMGSFEADIILSTPARYSIGNAHKGFSIPVKDKHIKLKKLLVTIKPIGSDVIFKDEINT